MKQSIGGVYVLNLVIIFLLIMFGFIMASFSYMKAFKVTKGVSAIIENSSGYNKISQKLISDYLDSVGYQKYDIAVENCPVKNEKEAVVANDGLCIYNVASDGTYLTYGIVSYMYIDLPLISLIKIPIYIETEKIYNFE